MFWRLLDYTYTYSEVSDDRHYRTTYCPY